MGTIFGSGRISRLPGGGLAAPLGTLIALPLYAAQLAIHWISISRQRRHLASLDERLLRDIGLDRSQVEREAGKPFWRL